MTTTEILAVIGGITVILTAAGHIPAALAEFLRACTLVVTAARDLRAALTKPSVGDAPAPGSPELDAQRTPGINAGDLGN